MLEPRTRSACLQAFCFLLLAGLLAAPAHAAPFVADCLGKGAVALDGDWQFHLGDNPAWAQADVVDTTGQNGWESIRVDAPWGAQTHPNQTGYGWYRRHIHISPAPGASPDVVLLIPDIDDLYELYWNGVRVGGVGRFPPHLAFASLLAAQTFGLGPIRDGVLAVRVLKLPFNSTDDGTAGGFEGVPHIGSLLAITQLKESRDYHWLRSQQFRFGLTTLYVLTSFLSFVAWRRDRKQRLLLWMAAYTIMPLLELVVTGLRLPFDGAWLIALTQTSIQVRELCQWYLLVYLLQLDDSARLMRYLRIVAWGSLIIGTADGCLYFLVMRLSEQTIVWTDALLTAIFLPLELLPAGLVILALVKRKRLDAARWLVALLAFGVEPRLPGDSLHALDAVAAHGAPADFHLRQPVADAGAAAYPAFRQHCVRGDPLCSGVPPPPGHPRAGVPERARAAADPGAGDATRDPRLSPDERLPAGAGSGW
jgi:hypothetical protein